MVWVNLNPTFSTNYQVTHPSQVFPLFAATQGASKDAEEHHKSDTHPMCEAEAEYIHLNICI